MKKRIIFSSLEEQSALTQQVFAALTPVERWMQLYKDIERLYKGSFPKPKTLPRRIIIDEYIS